MLFLLLATGAISKLTAYSSMTGLTSTLSFQSTSLGDPGLYAIYGKAVFISSYPQYPAMPALTGSFAVFQNFQAYSLAKLALLAQTAGAVGVIFASHSTNWDFTSQPNDPADEKKINIVCLKILRADANKFKNTPGNVWINYIYDLIKRQSNSLNFYISGNYTNDKVFSEALEKLNYAISLNMSAFTLSVYVTGADSSTSLSNDCISPSSSYFCMNSITGVTGVQKLNNSLLILKFFRSSRDMNTFLDALNYLYTNCEFDYTSKCISNQLSLSQNLTASEIQQLQTSFVIGGNFPKVSINSVDLIGADKLSTAFCLSSLNPLTGCTPCSSSCSSSLLQNSFCDQGCNNSACSYDNLLCLNTNDCYRYYINDGACDLICTKDPDCPANTTDICSSGCLFSEMKAGQCPYECTGKCFENCDSKYCSPGCLISDLKRGICSSNCTTQCMEECFNSTDICQPGCFYSEMKEGFCDRYCSGDCFDKCSSAFCSPECKYSELETGDCSLYCTDSCLAKCNIECPDNCYDNFQETGECDHSECSQVCCRKKPSSGSTIKILLWALVSYLV